MEHILVTQWRWLPCEQSSRIDHARAIQRIWSPFCVSLSEVLSCICRVYSETHMAECCQSQQLWILARNYIQQCVTVLPLSRRNHQGSHGAHQAGRQIYKTIAPRKFINHSCGTSWATGRQEYTRVGVTTKRNTHTCNKHKQVVHRLHRHIPCAIKKWKPVRYGRPSFFQCNFSCSL